MDVNKVTLIGRLVGKPEVHERGVTLRLAVSAPRRQELVVETRGKLAGICERYILADSRLYCEAHFAGKRLIADEIILLSSVKKATPKS